MNTDKSQAEQFTQDAVMQSVLKASDLRINNFISDIHATDKFYGVVNKVDKDKVYYNGFVSKIEDVRGIPLTDEWLLKLGFELLYTGKFRKVYDFAKDLRFGYSDNHGLSNTQSAVTFVGNSFTHIKYVHQLQNLYFALTQRELTVA